MGWPAHIQRDQQQCFRDWIRQIIVQHGVQLVGEEADFAYLIQQGFIKTQKDVIAYDVACECNVKYEEIDSMKEREKKSIPAYSINDSQHSNEQKDRWNKQRERDWFEKTWKKASGLDVVLLICGRKHKDRLAQLFCDAGHDVQLFDVTSEDWFIDSSNWATS